MDLSTPNEQDIVLQRFYHPRTGEECVLVLSDVLKMIRDGRTPDQIRDRHPALLDDPLRIAKLVSDGKAFMLDAWLEGKNPQRQNLLVMVDDSFPDEFVNFLQDQIGLSSKYSTLAGFPRSSQGRDLKRAYNRMARMVEARALVDGDPWAHPDVLLIRDRFGPDNGQNITQRLGGLAKMFKLSAEPRDVNKPQPLVAILHWEDDHAVDNLTQLMRRLSSYLPRILDDRATRMIYAGSDLGIYPPVDADRHLKIFQPKAMRS